MTATSNNDDVRRMIILDRGTDSELGIVGLGYSPDNGEHFFVTNTIKGRVFRQRDVNMLWPLLVDKIKSTMSLAWDDIQGKPMLVTKEELDQRLAKLNISTTVSWNDIQNKPDVALRSDLPDMSNYVTQDQLPAPVDLSGYAKIGDIPSLDGYAKLKDIPSVSGLVKETELADYAKKSDLPTMPDLSGYATVSSLIDYAKKSDLPDFSKYALKNELPITMAWQNITGKPDLATQDDLKNIELKPGPAGKDGQPGKDGAPGKDGKDGQPGRDGTDGKSAYQIWLANGHLGTETDFLNSLKGAPGKDGVNGKDGAPGIPGKDGDRGPQGLPGKDGVTPHIDSTTGDWFIGSQDTGTQAQGPAGKNGRDGVDGQPGKDGQNGITPHIDTATGNWFVGSTDTGIKAQGPQGIQGVPGKDGTDVDLSGYAKESEILHSQVSEWSTVGVSLLDGTTQASDNPVRYRIITLGSLHRVEVTGWLTTTIVGGRFNSKVRIPRMGFENATKMSFSGGTTLSAYGDIVSFFAGQPGEINFFSGSKTLNNANFQINCHWIYEG